MILLSFMHNILSQVHESELVQELTLKRIEADKAEKSRIADAVSAAEVSFINVGDNTPVELRLKASVAAKTSELLNFLRLRALLTSGELEVLTSSLNHAEGAAVFSAADTLLSEDGESKQVVLNGFLSGVGEFEGVTCMVIPFSFIDVELMAR